MLLIDLINNIYLMKYIKLFENFKLKPPYYFLRWTNSPQDDVKRNFSGHMQCWVNTEEECWSARKREGNRQYEFDPKKDPVSGMWNYDPEWGISGYLFFDEKTFNESINKINDISWYHNDDLNQDLALFKSYELGDINGYDGEELFRNIEFISYIDSDISYNDICEIISNYK